MITDIGDEDMKYTALIVAAGSGSRMGLGYNKMLYRFQNGKTILETTVSIFLKDERCKEVIVVGGKDDIKEYQTILKQDRIVFALGGQTRQESVHCGLKKVTQEYVLIHDGARPWLTMDCIDHLCQALEEHPACLLMVPVKDTIKQVKDGKIVTTLNRSELWQAQTPQAFLTSIILDCHEQAIQDHIEATDDAQLVELCSSQSVYVVKGDYENLKVTTIEDIKGR